MAGQKQHFSEAMRTATSPNQPQGGSKLARGREPTVEGFANMMRAASEDDTRHLRPAPMCPQRPYPLHLTTICDSIKSHLLPTDLNRMSRTRSLHTVRDSSTSRSESLKRNGGVLSQRTITPGSGFSDEEYHPSFQPRCGSSSSTPVALTNTHHGVEQNEPKASQLGERIFRSLFDDNSKPGFREHHISSLDRVTHGCTLPHTSQQTEGTHYHWEPSHGTPHG
jgi:hypothetical protein